MPIDESLLRSEQDRSKLQRWQQLRRKNKNLQPEDVLNGLVELDVALRKVSRDVQAQRTYLHRLQQSLDPQRLRQNPSPSHEEREKILKNIKKLKSETLPSLELQSKMLSNALSSRICQLGNFVDEKLLILFPLAEAPCEIDLDVVPSLPDELHDGNVEILGDDDRTFPRLQQALMSYALDFVRKLPSATFQIQRLPDEWTVTKSDAHDMIGCEIRPSCMICAWKDDHDNKGGHDRDLNLDDIHNTEILTNIVLSSSLHCLSRVHRGKIYMEAQLPIINACISSVQKITTAPPIIGMHLAPAINDKVDSPKHEHDVNHRLPLMASEHMELLVLFNSPIDSLRAIRGYQQHLVNHLIKFYKSLFALSPSNARTTDGGVLRIRALPPEELLPCEASRVVVEGHFETSKSSSSPTTASSTVLTLGFVSNCLDYVSRSCQVKCRQRPGERAEFVYTLHVGWIIDSSAVLKCLLHNCQVMNATNYTTSNTSNDGKQNLYKHSVPSAIDNSASPAGTWVTPKLCKVVLPLPLIPYLPSDCRFSNKFGATGTGERTPADPSNWSVLDDENFFNPFDFLPLG